MMSYWNEIKEGKISWLTHKRFLRFSTGEFDKEPINIRINSKSSTIATGLFDRYELYEIITNLNPQKISAFGKFRGVIDEDNLAVPLDEFVVSKTKRRGVFEYEIDYSGGLKFVDVLFKNYGYFLGTIKGESFEIKTKKSVPKIGKNVDNFIKIKVSRPIPEIVRKVFLIPEDLSLKRGSINYKVFVNEINIPENAKDVREDSIRIGVIKRTLNFDKSVSDEFNFKI